MNKAHPEATGSDRKTPFFCFHIFDGARLILGLVFSEHSGIASMTKLPRWSEVVNLESCEKVLLFDVITIFYLLLAKKFRAISLQPRQLFVRTGAVGISCPFPPRKQFTLLTSI